MSRRGAIYLFHALAALALFVAVTIGILRQYDGDRIPIGNGWLIIHEDQVVIRGPGRDPSIFDYGGLSTLCVAYFLVWGGCYLSVAVYQNHRQNVMERRLWAGRCPICSYDLRATPDRCPECGAVVPSRHGALPKTRGADRALAVVLIGAAVLVLSLRGDTGTCMILGAFLSATFFAALALGVRDLVTRKGKDRRKPPAGVAADKP